MAELVEIDGSRGEGGGQILRSSLALSLITQRPVRLRNIRAGRGKPGLLRQHLTAVRLATALGAAETEGAALGSQDLLFEPNGLHAGSYREAVGTAGSAMLVLQTALPALLHLADESTLRLEGGTHNQAAPPFDFLQRVFQPLLARMGVEVELALQRPGFFPAGGGILTAAIRPHDGLLPLELLERGAHVRTYGEALLAHLPDEVGQRELAVLERKLKLGADDLLLRRMDESVGPGNVVMVTVVHEHITEVFVSFGEKHLRAEHVASQAAEAARRYEQRDTVVGHYLTDQLLLPLALAGGGCFQTSGLSPHASSNIEVIEAFLPVRFDLERRDAHDCILHCCSAD